MDGAAVTSVTDGLGELLRAAGEAGQPASFFHAFARVLHGVPGCVFATAFVIRDGQTERVFSTDEAHYPTGVSKPMRATAWWNQVVGRRECFLAPDPDAVEAAFFDHALIRSLGCGSVCSAPILFNGRCLGAVNLNGRASQYSQGDLGALALLAQTASPVFLHLLGQRDGVEPIGSTSKGAAS